MLNSDRILKIKNSHKLRYFYIKKLANEFYIINPLSPLPLTVGPISKHDIRFFRETLFSGNTKRKIEKLSSVFDRNSFSCEEINEYLLKKHGENYKVSLSSYLKLLIDTFISGDSTLNEIEKYINHKKLILAEIEEVKYSNSLFNRIKNKVQDIRFQNFKNSSETKEFMKYMESYIGESKDKDYEHKFYIISKGCKKECSEYQIKKGVSELPKKLPPFFPGCVCELHYSMGKPKFRSQEDQELVDWYSKLEWD